MMAGVKGSDYILGCDHFPFTPSFTTSITLLYT